TAEIMYLNHICRRGTALLCPYRVVYLPENSCKDIFRRSRSVWQRREVPCGGGGGNFGGFKPD
ncbi:hypothetical protein, partial [Nostoc sp.]